MAARMGDRPPIQYDRPFSSECPLMSDHSSTSDRPSLTTHPSMTDQDHHECSCSCSCLCRRRIGQQRSSCCKKTCVIIVALVISFLVNLGIGGVICSLHFWHKLPSQGQDMPRAPVDTHLLCLGQPRERIPLLSTGTQESSFRNNATCMTSGWMHDLAAEAILSKNCDYPGKELTAPFAAAQPSALLFLQAKLGTRLAWRPYFSSMTLVNDSLQVDTSGRYFVISVLAHPSHASAYRSHSILRQSNKTGSFQEVLMTKACQGVGVVGECLGSGKEGPESILAGVLLLDPGDRIYVNVSDIHTVCRNSYRTYLGVWKV